MDLAAILAAKSKPAAFILQRINADEVVKTANGKSHKHSRLGILAKLSHTINGADEAIGRAIDIAVL